MKILEHIENFFVVILESLLKVSLIIMTIGVFTQVILRMLFKTTFLPIEDLLPYSFSISTFAGSALLFRDKGHIAVTFLTSWMKEGSVKAVQTLSNIIVLLFFILFLYLGMVFVIDGRHQFSPLLKIPLFYIFIIVPMFAISSIVFFIRRILLSDKNKK